MKKHNIIIVLLCLTVCLFFTPSRVMSEEVKIKDIVVTNSSSDLLLYLQVVNAFTPEIIQGVENGLQATFSFHVELTKIRKGWPDKELYSGVIDHTMVYDNLKKEYTIVQGEKGDNSYKTDNIDHAKEMMAELNGLKIIPLNRLNPDQQYKLEVQVTLAKKTLPFYFHYLVPFNNFWDFKTDWYAVEFRF